ncbi:MAG: protein kinase [Polyangiaceae bacterium]|nr:protein kinase [Polyangiaceae bacterium]
MTSSLAENYRTRDAPHTTDPKTERSTVIFQWMLADPSVTRRGEQATSPDENRKTDVRTAAAGPLDRKSTRASDGLSPPPGYEFVSLLGRGGMGFVIAAREIETGREVAVKLLPPEMRENEELRTRLLREGAALRALNHPSIVRVYEVFPEELAIVMELVRGESLRSQIERSGPATPSEVRRIGITLCSALGAAHRAGIIHRDVKPANILIDSRGALKLADFGIAKAAWSDLTRAGASLGTPSYMPPEQLRGQRVDARADIYALGVTLFELATGTQLHRTADTIDDPRDRIVRAKGDVALARAIEKALKESPRDRYRSTSEFARALAQTRKSGIGTWLLGGAMCVSLLGLRADTRGAVSQTESPPFTKGSIAILPFEDRSGEPRLDFATSGLPQLLGVELETTHDQRVIGYYRLLPHVGGPEASRAEWLSAAEKFGAERVIWGEMSKEKHLVRVRMVAATLQGAIVGTEECLNAIEDVPECVRTSGRVLAHRIGAKIANPGSERRPLLAEQALQRGILALEQHRFGQAETWFLQASQFDPNSKEVAYYEALTSWWVERPKDITKAHIERARSGPLRDEKREFLNGLALLVDHRYEGALLHFRALAERFPEDRDVLYGLFEAAFHSGHPAEAAAVYPRIVAIVPDFKLGLLHLLEYAAANGNETLLDWVLHRPGVQTEALYSPWISYGLMARTDYLGTIAMLSRESSADLSVLDPHKVEYLLHANLLTDNEEPALAWAVRLASQDEVRSAIAIRGIQAARGRDDALLQEACLRAIEKREHPGEQSPGLFSLLLLELPEPNVIAARSLLSKLTSAAEKRDTQFTVAMSVIRALFHGAIETEESNELAQLVDSPFPEAAAIAQAFVLDRKGRFKEAISAWNQAISHTQDGRFSIVERFFLARTARKAGDIATVQKACQEVISPRVFSWAWPKAVGHCLLWQAEAANALSDTALSRSSLRRLVALRSSLPQNDSLLMAARALLAKLPAPTHHVP